MDGEIGVVEGERFLGRAADHLIDVGGERNHRLVAVGDVRAPEVSVVGEDDRTSVGRERVRRHDVAIGARFLVVALDLGHQHPLVAGGHVAQHQRRLGVVAGRVGEQAPVGADLGTHAAADGVRLGEGLARFAIEHADLPAGERRLVVAAAGAVAHREVDVPAVLAHRGAEKDVRLRRPAAATRRRATAARRRIGAGETQAAGAAVHIVHEEVVALRGDDVLAVGREGRRLEFLIVLAGQRAAGWCRRRSSPRDCPTASGR